MRFQNAFQERALSYITAKKILVLPQICVLVCLFVFADCKKSSGSLNVTLYDKDTVAVKGFVQGMWKLRYYSTGSCGNCVFGQDSNNIIYSFSGNRIKITGNNRAPVDTEFVFVTYRGNSSDYVHNIISYYEGIVPIGFEANQIKNDTLIFSTPLIGAPDNQQGFLTKTN